MLFSLLHCALKSKENMCDVWLYGFLDPNLSYTEAYSVKNMKVLPAFSRSSLTLPMLSACCPGSAPSLPLLGT